MTAANHTDWKEEIRIVNGLLKQALYHRKFDLAQSNKTEKADLYCMPPLLHAKTYKDSEEPIEFLARSLLQFIT